MASRPIRMIGCNNEASQGITNERCTILVGKSIERDQTLGRMLGHPQVSAWQEDWCLDAFDFGITCQMPRNIGFMTEELLPSFQPHRHLGIFIFRVGFSVSLLSVVDVELLGSLCIIVIGGSEKLDRRHVMLIGMEFWDVEMVADTEIDKNILVYMEASERIG